MGSAPAMLRESRILSGEWQKCLSQVRADGARLSSALSDGSRKKIGHLGRRSAIPVSSRWELLKAGAQSQSRFDGFVEMLQRGLVPTEKHVILGTRAEASLNALTYRKVLLLDCRHQQIHVAIPMTPGAFRVGWLRRVERDVHDALVGRIAVWVDVPSLEMVSLHDEDMLGKST
jgi:hypothetical protein